MMAELDYEDMLLNGFESVDLRRENTMLKRKLAETEARLLQAQHSTSGLKDAGGVRRRIREAEERADRLERLNTVLLQRNEILNRKLREHNG